MNNKGSFIACLKTELKKHKLLIFVDCIIFIICFAVYLNVLINGLISIWAFFGLIIATSLLSGIHYFSVCLNAAILTELGKRDVRFIILKNNLAYIVGVVLIFIFTILSQFIKVSYEKAVTIIQIIWAIQAVSACVFFSYIFIYQKEIKQKREEKIKGVLSDKKDMNEAEDFNNGIYISIWMIIYMIIAAVLNAFATMTILLPEKAEIVRGGVLSAALLTVGCNLMIAISGFGRIAFKNIDLLIFKSDLQKEDEKEIMRAYSSDSGDNVLDEIKESDVAVAVVDVKLSDKVDDDKKKDRGKKRKSIYF